MSKFGKKQIMKTVSCVLLAGLLMGNEKCEQQADTGRRLKKNVKIIGVEASNFLDTPFFSFSEVAQSQLSGVLFQSNHFYERNVYPLADNVTPMPGIGMQKVSSQDQQLVRQMKTWFPMAKSQDVLFTKESWCLVSRPQHLVHGKINALEAYSGAALQFGFNQSQVQIPITANFKMDKMRMDLSFKSYSPWTMAQQQAVNVEEFKIDYKVGFGIDLGVIHIGPEFYRVTGMAELTLKALKKSVQSLAQALLNTGRQEWQTRIVANYDTQVVLLGGAELGLKAGDQIKVENEVHDWMGEACGDSSVLVGSISVTRDPWIVEVVEAGDMYSVAKVLNPKEDETMEIGALARVHKLYEPPAPTKKKK